MSEVSIRFSDVTFGYGTAAPLFQGVNCVLERETCAGKTIALVGPSGIGKSTFCDLVVGTQKPRSGCIQLTPTRPNVVVVPQRGVIFEELTVVENVACLRHSRTLGPTYRESQVPRAIDALGLGALVAARTPSRALSGGEAQRVMLARIQTVACDVVVLDEPCSFLDNRVKESFLRDLRATVDSQRLLALLVTHVWDEVEAVADEVVFFHKTVQSGVKMFHRTVSDARLRPPTVDALYTVHWPNCLLWDLADERFTGALRIIPDVPVGSRFLGLYSASLPGGEDNWATEVWQRSDGLMGQPAPPGRRRRNSLAEAIVPVFFNDVGLAVVAERQEL